MLIVTSDLTEHLVDVVAVIEAQTFLLSVAVMCLIDFRHENVCKIC